MTVIIILRDFSAVSQKIKTYSSVYITRGNPRFLCPRQSTPSIILYCRVIRIFFEAREVKNVHCLLQDSNLDLSNTRRVSYRYTTK
ncbi:hypothetical protein X975_11888, partial [Stegodyphus mimosarum]